ncbi:uncharacterized protein LOC129748093 [Uranotaenia lowii]|uniref:uncharacterized protein LOC129748093 n=1 Tax=Uranotaenia lowii TaxID=190385 RepID=UPI002478FD75|nr:uncharacterized protein LOC129748093 [Uranotaenia lowii]
MLETTNRQGLRIATGCSKTTPINSLAALSGEGPLSLKRVFFTKKRIALHIYKNDLIAQQLQSLNINSLKAESQYTYIERIFIKNYSEFQILYLQAKSCNMLNFTIKEQIIGSTLKKKITSPIVLKSLTQNMIKTSYHLYEQWFTDASKSGHKCGLGVFDATSEESISLALAHEVSITSAELLAIRVALEQVRGNGIRKVVIFTDSQAACKILKRDLKNKIFDKVTLDICTLATQKQATIQWLPSHIGITGNEKADELAKLGLECPAILENKLRLDDAIRNYKKDFINTTNKWYQDIATENHKGLKFFKFQNNFDLKPWYWNSEMNNKQIRTANRLLSGHDYSPYYLGLFRIRDTKLCELCSENFTTEHALFHCIQYNHVRNHYDWERYNNLFELINNFDEDKIKEVLGFLEKARLTI